MWILIFDSEWWTIIYGLVTIVNDHESWIKILNWLFLYQGVRILVLSFSIDHFLTFYFSDCVALSRSVSVVFSNFHPIPTPTSDGLFSCLNEAASYDMNHIIWTRWKKVGSPLSPDLSSWSSKWNNFPYTSNLNVWRVLFMTNHFVTFQEILNIQSAENSLAAGNLLNLTCGVSRRYQSQIHRAFLIEIAYIPRLSLGLQASTHRFYY